MGMPVLILGESGSGKSTSLRNFPPEKVAVLNVASKPLPFKNKLMVRNGVDYNSINSSLQKNAMKAYVIDDVQYLMSFEFFDHARETGYQKFTNLGKNFYDMMMNIRNCTSEDTIVYLLGHVEQVADGKQKMKTIGKMLDEKLTIEGLCTIVLWCKAQLENKSVTYKFITQTDGVTTAKSPMDMFGDLEIDNDLYLVDKTIREFYGFAQL